MSERFEELQEARQAEDMRHFNRSGRVALMKAIRKLSEGGVRLEDESPMVKLVVKTVRDLETTLP